MSRQEVFLRALLPFLLLVGALKSTTLALGLKLFVDAIAIGYSPAKTVVLLVFLCAVFWSAWMPALWRPGWNVWLVTGIVALHLTAFAERWLFVTKAGLPLNSYAVVVLDGRYTVTRLVHMHECKAVVAWLTRYRGSGFDSGFPFLPYFPGWLLAAHAVVLLAVTLMAFMAVQGFAVRKSTGETVCLALTVFALIKSSIDGGPLTPETAIPLPFLLGLLFGRRGWKWGGGLSLLYVPITFYFLGREQFDFNALKALGAYLLLSAPLLLERRREASVKRTLLLATAYTALMASLPWLQFKLVSYAQQPPFTVATLAYAYTPIPAGSEFTISDFRPLSFPPDLVEVVERWKGGEIFTYRVKALRDTTPLELAELFHLNIAWRPIKLTNELTYIRLVGYFPEPPPNWPSSELVTEYQRFRQGDGRTNITFAFRGGGDLTPAIDALPEGRAVVTGWVLLPMRPRGPWRPGPGMRRISFAN